MIQHRNRPCSVSYEQISTKILNLYTYLGFFPVVQLMRKGFLLKLYKKMYDFA
jgi:hypothetical protein